ncbi:MAG: C25 family cysteine peptidase [Pseudomonadota bacterium]
MRSLPVLALFGLGCHPWLDVAPARRDLLEGADLLIVAPAETIDGFDELVDWKRRRGIATRVEALEDIDATEAGPDTAARLRARLQRAWAEEGTRWVLLGADAPLVPVRMVDAWVDVHFEGTYYEGPVATDLYYADLDGEWDADGDGVWGEPGDGMDLWPDVAIGRIPARDADDVRAYTEKLIQYERRPVTDYQQTMMLMGEWAGEASGVVVYSSVALEEFILPLIPDEYHVTRMYEDYEHYEGAVPNTAQTQRDAFNAGQHYILDFGHGQARALANLGLDDLWALENASRPAFFATTECSGCDFEDPYYEHAACEAFVLSQGGGVAYLGNTHVGIGFPSLTNYFVAFYDALFGDDLAGLSLGERVAETQKVYTTPQILAAEGEPDRWSSLVMVLMGDPTLVPWRFTPVEPEVSDLQWYRWGEGRAGCVTIERDGVPVEGATMSWYHPRQLHLAATTGPAGRACIAVPEGAPDRVKVTITGPDLVPTGWQQKL